MENNKIISEVSELFGGYKLANGDIVDFITRSEEIAGKNFNDFNAPQIKNQEFSNPFLSGPAMTAFTQTRFYGWQKKIIQILEDKNDVYVVAPPGGGKTTPLMAYWFVNLFLQGKQADMKSLSPSVLLSDKLDGYVINAWSNIFSAILTKKYSNGMDAPKVLFITPIRVLSFEQAEAFQDLFLDLFVFLQSLFLYLPSDIMDTTKKFQEKMDFLKNTKTNICQVLYSVFSKLPEKMFNLFLISPDGKSEFENWVKQYVLNELISVKTGGGSGDFASSPENVLVVIATYGAAKNFINKIVSTVKFIVYDEAQKMMRF